MRRSMEVPVDPYFDAPGLPDLEPSYDPASDWAFWEGSGPLPPLAAGPVSVSPTQDVGFSIGDAVEAQYAGNRAMAAQLAALARTVQTSRQNLSVYLLPAVMVDPDAAELAERAAAKDASMQLNLSVTAVRNRAYKARTLIDSLPRLWELFQAGVTSYEHVSAAVQHVVGLSDPAALTRYDTVLAGTAAAMTPEAFRRKARTLQERLLAEPAETRHGRALTARRVFLEPAEDGMAWLHVHLAAEDGIRIHERLRKTARSIHRKEAKTGSTGAGAFRRTQMQIRTDLAVGWLAGDGTPTAAKVRPILLVPILSLLGLNNASQNESGAQPAILHGYGPIDPVSAAKLFHDAPAFLRAGTDPITGALLNLDRGKYRPTKAQRTWLTIKYGSCASPGCDCSSTMADIDHVREWVRDHGPTNITNLIPLCVSDHRIKTLSTINVSKTEGPDGTDRITITTPTGHTATRLARARPAWWDDDDPPF